MTEFKKGDYVQVSREKNYPLQRGKIISLYYLKKGQCVPTTDAVIFVEDECGYALASSGPDFVKIKLDEGETVVVNSAQLRTPFEVSRITPRELSDKTDYVI